MFAAVAGTFAPLRCVHYVGWLKTADTFDVAVFYCGARQIGHADPYQLGPLARCERTTSPRLFSDVAVPAPQPAYVLAALNALSWLSEERFAFTWLVMLVGLALASSGFLARLTGFPATGIFLGTIVGPGYDNLMEGQLSLLVVLGIAGAAYALRIGRPRLASLLAVLTFAEPHVALPVVIALFVLERRTRMPLVIACAGALAVSIAVTSPAITLEYFTRLLPLQALVEVRNPDQYSVTLLAALAGASDAVALRLGELQYALFSIGSVWVAKRLRDRYGDAAFLVAIPAAAAVIGGPYIHYSEMIALWPALLLLASRARGRSGLVAALAIAVTAYPWRSAVGHWERLGIVGVFALFALAMTARLERRARILVCSAFAVPVAIAGVLKEKIPKIPVLTIPSHLADYLGVVVRDRDLSPIEWGLFMRQDYNVLTLREVATKLPTLAVIAILIYFAFAFARPVAQLPNPERAAR